MTASPHVTSNFSNFYQNGPLYEAAVLDGAKIQPLLIDAIFKMAPFPAGPDGLPMQRVRWRSLAGMALPDVVAEAASLPLSDVVQRYTRELVAKKLANSLAYTDESEKFSGGDQTLAEARNQGASFVRAFRKIGAQVFNQAFTTSPAGQFGECNSWDAKALCATDHPLISGTCSNMGTGVLSQSNLATALKTCAEFKDDRGNSAPMNPRMLIVPPALKDTAIRLTESASIAEIRRSLAAMAGDPTRALDESPGAVNPIAKDGLQVVTFTEIGASYSASGDYAAGSDTAWFLVDPMQFDARMYTTGITPSVRLREGSGLTATIEFWTYYAMGCGDWRGIYGSNGTV